MAEVFVEFAEPVVAKDGATYIARACGGEMDNGIHPRHRPPDGGTVRERRLDELVRHAGEIRQPADRQVVENLDPLAAFGEQPDEG